MDDKQKYDHAVWLEEKNREDAQRVHDNNRESIIKSNEATVNSGSNAIRAALIINGGAAIALLSFIGGLVGDGKLTIGSQLQSVTEPLRYFAWGVALSAVSMAFGYLTNFSATGILQNQRHIWKHPYLEETSGSKRWRVAYNVFLGGSVLTAIVSLVAFICGMIVTRNAIGTLH